MLMTLFLVASGSVEVHAIEWQKKIFKLSSRDICNQVSYKVSFWFDYVLIVAAIKHSKNMEYYEVGWLFLNMLVTWERNWWV